PERSVREAFDRSYRTAIHKACLRRATHRPAAAASMLSSRGADKSATANLLMPSSAQSRRKRIWLSLARWPCMPSYPLTTSPRFVPATRRRHLHRATGHDFPHTAHRGTTRSVARDVVGDLLHAVEHGRVIPIEQTPDFRRRQVAVFAQQIHRHLARPDNLLVAGLALRLVGPYAGITLP